MYFPLHFVCLMLFDIFFILSQNGGYLSLTKMQLFVLTTLYTYTLFGTRDSGLFRGYSVLTGVV